MRQNGWKMEILQTPGKPARHGKGHHQTEDSSHSSQQHTEDWRTSSITGRKASRSKWEPSMPTSPVSSYMSYATVKYGHWQITWKTPSTPSNADSLETFSEYNWPQTISNEALYARTKTEPWNTTVRRRRLNWLGYDLICLYPDTLQDKPWRNIYGKWNAHKEDQDTPGWNRYERAN